MARLSVVLTAASDWAPYHPSDDLVEVDSYLAAQARSDTRRLVINLCRDYQYLSRGYYCSLLAESRGQRVLPSIRTINNLGNRSLYVLDLADLNATLAQHLGAPQHAVNDKPDDVTLRIYFGWTADSALQDLARQIFELFPCPILDVRFRYRETWSIDRVRPVGVHRLDDSQQNAFADAFDRFSRNIWRERNRQRTYNHDLAILVDPHEALPPSNARALKRIETAMRREGIDVDLITRRDYARLPEYDALFIRETTAIDNHTYRFAKRAEREGAVVVDDPASMLRCTNKVYLANLLEVNRIPRPRTIILNRHRPEQLDSLHRELAFPVVLKIPDGAFSKGIVKANDMAALTSNAEQFFKRSALIIAQEFYPTDFDWRIGVFNGQLLFCCQYFMSRGHWQIYKHGEGGKVSSGGFRTVAVDEAPQAVLEVALQTTRLIGDGLYGVDIKQRGEQAVVVEVNDNPNIDAGIEDAVQGKALYQRIAREFRRRLDERTFAG